MQKVTIVGLGLIGASIGMGLRRWSTNDGKRAPVLEVTGFDLDLEHQNYSKKIRAVDRTEWDLAKAIADADLIIVAVPPLAVREVFEAVGRNAKSGAVITDTTSTKAQVMEWAKLLLPTTTHFIGGHPMAGKSQSIEGADADLFKGATWCIVPAVRADDNAVQTVLGMISSLGAEPMFVDEHEHDSFVAGISHLPFLLSISLMHSVSSDPAWRDMKFLTAGGFRDVSRLAAGSPEMHRDICATNRESIVRWIDRFVDDLQQARTLIASASDETDEALLASFRTARDARAEWATAERREGALVQDTSSELSKTSVGEQMQQMFVGSMFRRKPRLSAERGQFGKTNGSKDRNRDDEGTREDS